MANNGSSEQYKGKVMSALQDKSTLISLGIFLVFLIVAGVLIFTNQRKVSVSGIDNPPQNTATPSASPAPQTGQTYVVQEGDTLWSISEDAYKSGYNWVDIVEENNIQNPDSVAAGTELMIPSVTPRAPEGEIANAQTEQAQPNVAEVTVQEGDTLWSIATQVYGDGYAWSSIANANNLMNPNHIMVGQRLIMPKM